MMETKEYPKPVTLSAANRALSAALRERDSYRDELLKLASELGEGDDPFAAWESLASLLSVQKQLVEALEELRWVGNDLRERKAARAKADAAIQAAKAS
jgi:hypothetical protein